jgi:hypothetical protein
VALAVRYPLADELLPMPGRPPRAHELDESILLERSTSIKPITVKTGARGVSVAAPAK